MFETLSEKLQRAFKNLRGQGKLTEENMGEALREIRLALLEADVNVKVVKQFIDEVKAKAMGAEVMTSLSPAEQVVKLVRDEMVEILGKDTAKLKFASQPPTVVLMAGLQGSGKTTTTGKLAAWLKKGGHLPMLVSVDVYRPAARQQLKVVAEAIKRQQALVKDIPDLFGENYLFRTKRGLYRFQRFCYHLNEVARQVPILGPDGQVYRFKPHQFRLSVLNIVLKVLYY